MSAIRMWNRKLWGVSLLDGKERLHLLGALWNTSHDYKPHKGEPTRPLLFTTRQAAREWCKAKTAACSANPSIAHWRFVPVRVIECVVPI